MFGDLLGNVEEQQKQLQEKLAQIIIDTEAGDGAVKISANANQEILNISIDKDKIDADDLEQLEDLLLVAINRALEEGKDKAADASEELLKNMLPPGLSGLGGLFGG